MNGKTPTKLVIFDLDGTLVDSARDIALSVNELRVELGRASLPLATIESYIGNGVRALLSRAFDESSDEGLDVLHAKYLPIYRRRLLDNTRPYPFVEEVLDELKKRGLDLVVLTNKPRRESRMLLEGLGLSTYFGAIEGGDSFSHRKPNPVGAVELLARFETIPAEALFVGDSAIDLETARCAGIPCCLVRYGIGDTSDLTPETWIDDFRQLLRRVESNHATATATEAQP
jgi:phosphoglycolate phosphatase